MTTATATNVGNERFVHNMRALWRFDPQLALLVDAVPDEERLPLIQTRSDAWTVKMPAEDGTPTYLHSRYDPEAEAKRFADSIPIEEKFCFVVSGLGLGYHVRALFDRLRGDTFILCSEPSIPLIATALSCVDLADVIASRRFLIITDDDKARLHERLKDYGTLMMLGAQFVTHGPSMRVAHDAHTRISRAISDYVTYSRMTLTTLVSNAKITCRNVAMNLVHYATTPPIDMLKDRFAGDPAIIVAAGPSLTKNIDQLHDLKGRAVICAVQTTLKPLLQRGIQPDFVTSLDYHAMSRRFFEDVRGLEHTHLVAEPKATWHVIDHYAGPLSLLDNHWARLVIGDDLGARAGLPAGATVAHLAFYLAVYLGCDPIIFIGQDLAYTGHVYYVPGVEVHQAWRSELNRFCTIEQKEWERIARNRPILHRIPGNDGTELYTDELLFTYLEQFEKDIAATSARVINATEGGARIRGTEVKPLREAAEAHCTRLIDPERFAYRQTTNWRNLSRLPAARKQLAERIDELDEVVTVCDELLGLFKELEGLTHDPARFNRRLGRVDELRARVHRERRAYQIVSSFTQHADLKRFAADRRISTAEMDDAERALRQLKRDTEFITAVRDGAVEIKPILTEACNRMEAPFPFDENHRCH